MLPFDNKSEFQIVLDMPVGTPLEETARVLAGNRQPRSSRCPEVSDYQAYAGTASPINFNGLVRQYYLRAAPELGDLQVNLVDHKQRSRQSHEIATSVRDAVEAIGRRAGGNAKVVEVPPGRRFCRRSSPRSMGRTTGPDRRGQGSAPGVRGRSRIWWHRRFGHRRRQQDDSACLAEQGGAARRRTERHRRRGAHGLGRRRRDAGA
jgi:hypothetical protein